MTDPRTDDLYRLIDRAGVNHVSDIHIHPGEGTWVQIEGVLRKDSSPNSVLGVGELAGWLAASSGPAVTPEERLGAKGQVSVAYDTGSFRARAAYRRDTTGISVTIRLVPYEIPTAEALGIPMTIQNLMTKTAGLILIEGPTNSGKTTDIAALIEKANHEQERHIYLIEDPIEYVHTAHGNTVLTQREIGIHALDFASAVENALRSTPHIIVIGEMLDNATKKAVLLAATTGHLVLTTAHAGSVVEAIGSFIGEFPADEQPQVRTRLSQSLLAVMTQRLLVPRTAGERRVPVHEVSVIDSNIQGLIRDNNMHLLHSQLESAQDAFSLEQSLVRLVGEGRITADTAMAETRLPDELLDALKRNGST